MDPQLGMEFALVKILPSMLLQMTTALEHTNTKEEEKINNTDKQ